MNQNTCCFFGHRKIKITDELKTNLYNEIKYLITKESIDTFIFGSKSQFDDLCHEIVSELKVEYHFIKRVYVRAEFPYIDDDYHSYLLESYEETYYPPGMLNAGKLSYIERNYEMINSSKFCIVYFDEDYTPPSNKGKSGTKIAYDYALKKKKTVINLFNAQLRFSVQ